VSGEDASETLSDAELAFHLFIRNPTLFGGIILRGDGPVRDAMVEVTKAAIAPVRKIPANVDGERLLGGLDLSATLAAGVRVTRPGLLEEASGGVVLVSMAERLRPDVAAHIAQALDSGDLAVILLDDGHEADELPPIVLAERLAFHCDVSALRSFDEGVARWPKTKAVSKVKPLTDRQLATLAAMSVALGISSARALIFANAAARAHAALHGRTKAKEADVEAAVRLVLAPRATRMPAAEPPMEQPPDAPPPQPDSGQDGQGDVDLSNIELQDILLEAAAAAIPPHILDRIEKGVRSAAKGQAGRAGDKRKSAQRGRPLGARSGIPGNGRRLALIDSLRAAAPWQTIRRAAASPGDQRTIHIRKSDLRVRHYEQRSESLTIFAVDASGSSALSRLAEAKGAVELMLAEAYVKRTQVALIAFRQDGAEILLPPTRSLTRARRALSALPGGGGTPLAAGLLAAQTLADAARKRGQTPTLAILTDGKANVRMDGSANRDGAMEEARTTAKILAQGGMHSIVIDISPRPRPEAAELADALQGRYLPLPQAHSSALGAAMVAAIESL
jgi:magnesium chelatase subunit D